ncbi:hypothetical protein CXU22_06235 [Akkermansia muciniphila]|uniref:Uncharacterized protein n=1 Tax=Akkermansia muciniphila TaxID=239935 RepID=A0A2N8HE22_9BACT|nr:hypothetical protein CXU22_06235 [Akkermansia muciniphila]
MQKPGNSGYLPRSSSYNTIVILIEGGRGRIISIKYLIFTRSQASVVILRGAAPPPLAGSLFSFSLSLKEKRIRSTAQDLTRKLTFRFTLGTPLTGVPKVALPSI